ncbi:hypothetical protein ASAP_0644 [Asaia bogorensis]|uniref:Uncharacterized protein n=2 Tax=Acetobacteraceae TaxID=433 RepID=A0A060QC63_9PROT|nr:hypothetical protein P792_14690 [Asaia sp. SF2.1]CDG38689.1 hypothetical protein ASAP_0644 [Asaia bogorensis]
MIMTGASGYARANAPPHCTSPQEVVSGTRLTINRAEGYFDWQTTHEAFRFHPVFHLDFVSCIPDIVSFNTGVFATRDRQIFELSPQGLKHRGTGRAFDPAFDDQGETRRCNEYSTTADICLERGVDHAVIFIENHRPPRQRIELIISRTRAIRSFAFLPSPDTPGGLVSLMIDGPTG